MDWYKRIIKNQTTRFRILKMLTFVPDKQMIQFQYRIKMKRRLNLQKPVRFTEKLQWYKLYYRNPIMIECVDKHAVRDFVINRLGTDSYLIPETGVWNSADDIDVDGIAGPCVVKTTNGSETNLFIHDPRTANWAQIKQQLDIWLHWSVKSAGREWAYDNVIPRIICQPMLQGGVENGQHGEGLDDYKFFCFDGKIALRWIDFGRFSDHKRVLFDNEGNRLPVNCTYDSPEDTAYPREAFETLEPIVLKLAQGFPQVRVDMYYVNHKPYFGELTFYSGGGYEAFSDDQFDIALGAEFRLPPRMQ